MKERELVDREAKQREWTKKKKQWKQRKHERKAITEARERDFVLKEEKWSQQKQEWKAKKKRNASVPPQPVITVVSPQEEPLERPPSPRPVPLQPLPTKAQPPQQQQQQQQQQKQQPRIRAWLQGKKKRAVTDSAPTTLPIIEFLDCPEEVARPYSTQVARRTEARMYKVLVEKRGRNLLKQNQKEGKRGTDQDRRISALLRHPETSREALGVL